MKAWWDTELLIKGVKYGVPKVSTKGSSLGDQHEINDGKTHLNGMICNRAQQLRNKRPGWWRAAEDQGARGWEMRRVGRAGTGRTQKRTPQTNDRLCLTTAPSIKNTTFLDSRMYFRWSNLRDKLNWLFKTVVPSRNSRLTTWRPEAILRGYGAKLDQR